MLKTQYGMYKVIFRKMHLELNKHTKLVVWGFYNYFTRKQVAIYLRLKVRFSKCLKCRLAPYEIFAVVDCSHPLAPRQLRKSVSYILRQTTTSSWVAHAFDETCSKFLLLQNLCCSLPPL